MKLNFISLLISLYLIGGDELKSQSSNFKWVKALDGDVTNNIGFSVVTDAAGNVYTSGYFCGNVDLDPGPGTYDVTSVSVQDVFVTKLDSSGNFVWGKTMGSGFSECGTSIAVDASGNVIVAGIFEFFLDIDPDINNSVILPGSGANDIFLVKLSSTGNFVWGFGIGGVGYEGAGGIKLDAGGNIYYTGSFEDTVDFDPGPAVLNLYESNGSAFVMKLNGSGNLIYARNFGGTAISQAISLDSGGNIYTTGIFKGTGDFDPGSGISYSSSNTNSYDAFVSKLNNAGNFVWAKTFGGADDDVSYSIGVDAAGNVYTCGTFSATVDFDPGPGVSNLSSAGDLDIFVSKLNSTGNLVWAKAISGSTTQIARALAVNSLGDIILSGAYTGLSDFDPGPGTYTLNSSGYIDVFVVGLNSSGNLLYAKRMGGAGASAESYGMCLDAQNNILTTGYYYGTVDFNPDAPTINLNSGAAYDSFIHKMKPSYTVTVTGLAETLGLPTYQLIYPNPCTDWISLRECENDLCDLQIYDVNGVLLKRLSDCTDSRKIDVHDLNKGLYIVEIIRSDQTHTKAKVIKQ